MSAMLISWKVDGFESHNHGKVNLSEDLLCCAVLISARFIGRCDLHYWDQDFTKLTSSTSLQVISVLAISSSFKKSHCMCSMYVCICSFDHLGKITLLCVFTTAKVQNPQWALFCSFERSTAVDQSSHLFPGVINFAHMHAFVHRNL